MSWTGWCNAGAAGEISFDQHGRRRDSRHCFQRFSVRVLAVRERATNFASNARGCDGKLVAYTSTQAHSSIEKAVKIAGLGGANLRAHRGGRRTSHCAPTRLRGRSRKTKPRGLIPCFVCATVGHDSSNAMDPVPEIGAHLPRAQAMAACRCCHVRHCGALPGVPPHSCRTRHADSYCFNPHKWMFTNFDCDCFYVADRKALIQTLSVLPEYLRNQATESGAVFDYRDWQIPLGRRFRALKFWFVIRHYGVEGLAASCARARRPWPSIRGVGKNDERFELAAPGHSIWCASG